MKHLIKTVSFLSVMAVIPGAFAATSRASIMGQATSRLPSIAGYVNPVALLSGSTTSGSTTASSLLTNTDCIDAYNSCIKANDACGPNFEECTTNVLFHAQMPKCLNVLSQCTSSGINDLFGTSSVAALSNVAEKNTYGEVTRYTYPTDGSVLGQTILGASIANKYDAQQCVKRYTSCLKKDSVCGNDFELCTSPAEFKKQSIFCASTLARCQSDGIIELYGSTNTSVAPKSDSRLGMMIAEGAELAAVNAVSTCYKVADQCILNACGSNPAKCMENASSALALMTEAINNGVAITDAQLAAASNAITKGDVNKYIKNMCQETIGGNKYCYATANDGKMPTASQLTDPDNNEMVFEEVYAVRMTSAMKQRLQTILDKFDEKTKEKCVTTMKTCAMRSCGGGVGSACYASVFLAEGSDKSINGRNTYDEIKVGCEAITNTDPNCQYAVASTSNTAYMYAYTDNNTFTTLFPEYAAGGDPIGVVAALNASLATSYNDAAIAQMKKQCSNTVVSCVKSMCGKDYKNCYRNRTDIMGDTYKTDSDAFNRSMNKVGGVLDYGIVTGLCVNTVKNAKVCEEHLKIEAEKLKKQEKKSEVWGSDVRGDWLTAASSVSATDNRVHVGCRVSTDSNGCDISVIVDKELCNTVDEEGCMYDYYVYQDRVDYVNDVSATNLFQQVLVDLEKEAQAKYNAKLTKEQNICIGNNNGGIMGNADNGSAFMWVKLKSNRVPANYIQQGLKPNQFTTSNDLYGSFCRARISIVSDDPAINKHLGEKATAYFAVGDAFECGSWIDDKTMGKIEQEIRDGAGMSSWKKKAALAWSTVGGGLLGGTAGGLVGNYLANGKIGGNGLLNSDAKVEKNKKTNAGSCISNLEKCLDNDVDKCRAGLRDARAAGISVNIDWTGTGATYYCNEDASKYTDYLFCKSDTKCTQEDRCCKTDPNNEKNFIKKYGATAGFCVDSAGNIKGVNDVIGSTSVDVSKSSLSQESRNKIEKVLAECQSKAKNNNSSGVATGLGVGIGTAAGALLGFGVAKTVVDAKDAQEKDKAVAEWKESLRDHIRCYVSGEDLGGYGEYISFKVDDMN